MGISLLTILSIILLLLSAIVSSIIFLHPCCRPAYAARLTSQNRYTLLPSIVKTTWYKIILSSLCLLLFILLLISLSINIYTTLTFNPATSTSTYIKYTMTAFDVHATWDGIHYDDVCDRVFIFPEGEQLSLDLCSSLRHAGIITFISTLIALCFLILTTVGHICAAIQRHPVENREPCLFFLFTLYLLLAIFVWLLQGYKRIQSDFPDTTLISVDMSSSWLLSATCLFLAFPTITLMYIHIWYTTYTDLSIKQQSTLTEQQRIRMNQLLSTDIHPEISRGRELQAEGSRIFIVSHEEEDGNGDEMMDIDIEQDEMEQQQECVTRKGASPVATMTHTIAVEVGDTQSQQHPYEEKEQVDDEHIDAPSPIQAASPAHHTTTTRSGFNRLSHVELE